METHGCTRPTPGAAIVRGTPCLHSFQGWARSFPLCSLGLRSRLSQGYRFCTTPGPPFRSRPPGRPLAAFHCCRTSVGAYSTTVALCLYPSAGPAPLKSATMAVTLGVPTQPAVPCWQHWTAPITVRGKLGATPGSASTHNVTLEYRIARTRYWQQRHARRLPLSAIRHSNVSGTILRSVCYIPRTRSPVHSICLQVSR